MPAYIHNYGVTNLCCEVCACCGQEITYGEFLLHGPDKCGVRWISKKEEVKQVKENKGLRRIRCLEN